MDRMLYSNFAVVADGKSLVTTVSSNWDTDIW
jgi:hypothetical protein